MEYVALTGPLYSGKSTLARELSHRGYLLINFTDTLKAEAVRALRGVGIHTTVGKINAAKKRFRPFLQGLGDVLDFDADPEWVLKALGTWTASGMPKAVFDNVRTAAQFRVLQGFGFELVEIKVDSQTQHERARALNVSEEDLIKAKAHPIEAGVGRPDYVSLYLDARSTIEQNIQILLGEKEDISRAS